MIDGCLVIDGTRQVFYCWVVTVFVGRCVPPEGTRDVLSCLVLSCQVLHAFIAVPTALCRLAPGYLQSTADVLFILFIFAFGFYLSGLSLRAPMLVRLFVHAGRSHRLPHTPRGWTHDRRRIFPKFAVWLYSGSSNYTRQFTRMRRKAEQNHHSHLQSKIYHKIWCCRGTLYFVFILYRLIQ